MNYRNYGTVRPVTLASLGGQSLLESPNEEDIPEIHAIINTFLDSGGVLMDTSPVYTYDGYERLSEKRFGEVLPFRNRASFMIATKTEYRTMDDALRDLERSLDTLHLDYVDEWRLHHLNDFDELDTIFSQNGAIKAMERTLDEGLVLRPSISGHSDPKVLLEALRRFPFQSVLGAVNVADRFIHSFQKELIPYCNQNGIPFIGMKIAGKGALLKKHGIDSFQDAFNYALSIPGVTTAIVGMSNLDQLHRLIECDEHFRQLGEHEMKRLEERVESYAKEVLFFRKGEEWPDWAGNIFALKQQVM